MKYRKGEKSKRRSNRSKANKERSIKAREKWLAKRRAKRELMAGAVKVIHKKAKPGPNIMPKPGEEGHTIRLHTVEAGKPSVFNNLDIDSVKELVGERHVVEACLVTFITKAGKKWTMGTREFSFVIPAALKAS